MGSYQRGKEKYISPFASCSNGRARFLSSMHLYTDGKAQRH